MLGNSEEGAMRSVGSCLAAEIQRILCVRRSDGAYAYVAFWEGQETGLIVRRSSKRFDYCHIFGHVVNGNASVVRCGKRVETEGSYCQFTNDAVSRHEKAGRTKIKTVKVEFDYVVWRK